MAKPTSTRRSPIWVVLAIVSLLVGVGLLTFTVYHVPAAALAWWEAVPPTSPDFKNATLKEREEYLKAVSKFRAERSVLAATTILPLFNTLIFFVGVVYTTRTFGRTNERQRFETTCKVITQQNELRRLFGSDPKFTKTDKGDSQLLDAWIAKDSTSRSRDVFFIYLEQLGVVEMAWHAFHARQISEEQWRNTELRTYSYMVQSEALRELAGGAWNFYMHPDFRALLKAWAMDIESKITGGTPQPAYDLGSALNASRSGYLKHWWDTLTEE